MGKVKFFLTSFLIPFCMVFLLSLHYFIILRVYPTILNFDTNSSTTNTQFASLFYLMISFGSSIAFLLHDFIIGARYTILISLLAEFIILIVLSYTKNSNRLGIYIYLGVVGVAIGILQTCISAFFGDRYTSDFWYSQLSHFHIYLLGVFIANLLSIVLVPLYYAVPEYGVCYYSDDFRVPFYIAIACIPVVFGLCVIYFRSLRRRSSNLKSLSSTINLMQFALCIFIPLVIFWMFTFLHEHFLMVQRQNMLTKLQSHDWELIWAVASVLCIPICWFLSLNGNEFFRIALGGMLISISAFYSMFLDNFNQPYRNISIPDNHTMLYACQMGQHYNVFYNLSGLEIFVPDHDCNGPYFIKTELLNKTIPIIVNKVKYFVPNLPNSSVVGLSIRETYYAKNGPNKIEMFPERNFRSLSTLAFLRIISYDLSPPQGQVRIFGGEQNVNITIPLSYVKLMELPPGQYTIYYDQRRTRIFYFRSGGYYTVIIDQAVDIVTRIKGYDGNIYHQIFPYIVLSFGKLFIMSSALNIAFTLAESHMKCSFIGIFWSIYYLAHSVYYLLFQFLRDSFVNKISGIYLYMMASIGLFRVFYYFMAYKLTDIILLGDSVDDDTDTRPSNHKSVKVPTNEEKNLETS